MRAGLEVDPDFLSVSPPFGALGPPALDLAPPSAGALGTVATLPGPALLLPSPLPAGGLAPVLAGVLLIDFTDPAFDPGPILEPAASVPFALGLDALDSLDLIGLFPAVLEGFFTPPATGFSGLLLTFSFPLSPAFFPSSLAFTVPASVPPSVEASAEEATSEFATSSELRRRFGVAGVT